jgi:hypothetical protein
VKSEPKPATHHTRGDNAGVRIDLDSDDFTRASRGLVARHPEEELARVRGDAAGAARGLAEVQRLFTEMGAMGHAERVAKLLAESPR